MEKLISMLEDENVDVASPYLNSKNEYNKLDKEQVKLQLETRKKLEDIQLQLIDSTFEERRDWILDKKNEANQLFKSQKFKEAQQIYLDALMGILDRDITPKQKKEFEDIKFSILCNMAMAACEINFPKKSISLLQQAVKIKINAKTNYLFAISYLKLQEFQAAVEYIESACELLKTEDCDEKRKELYHETATKIIKQYKNHISKEKKMYQNVFGEPIKILETKTNERNRPLGIPTKKTEQRTGFCRKIKLVIFEFIKKFGFKNLKTN